MLPGVKLSSRAFDLLSTSCEVCLLSKQTRQNFPVSSNKANKGFDLIHCDLWGPYQSAAVYSSHYFLTIVDEHSRAVWIYLLRNKTNASTHLRDFLAPVRCQFDANVKTILSENGIIHKTLCVGTPQQNGQVKRKHRHILDVARALCFQAALPIDLWDECALTTCYLINRTPSQLFGGKTPFELLYGRPPTLTHLCVFRSLCYVHNLDYKGDKFASRSHKCAFIGYPYCNKG